MYLLYADDSGVPTDPNVKYSVLAGFVTFEDQTFWIARAIDDIMLRHIGRTDLEIHASPMRSGRGIWRSFPKEKRNAILIDCFEYIRANYPRQFILFGAVIGNKYEDISEKLFTQISSRFDKFLKRKYSNNSQSARGLIIFDKSKMEKQYQNYSKIHQSIGNQWQEKLFNFSEVPLFLDSKMSRSIQLADLIAFALFRKYEYDDDSYFSIIKNCFDKEKNSVHGLYVYE